MKMTIKIVTSKYKKEITDVTSLHLKTIDGDITILPNHYPLVTAIDISEVKIKKGKEVIEAFASNGLMNVREKEVILLLNAFEFENEIDIDRALKSKERAETRINSKDEQIDLARAEASLKRAIMRLNIAKYN